MRHAIFFPFPSISLAIRISLLLIPEISAAASPAWLTAHDTEIKALVERMTLQEKVGQMTQPDLGSIKDLSDIQTLFLGSVLSGGGSDPKSGNTLSDWSNVYQECQNLALKTRLAIPLLYGVDAVHGHNNVLGAVIFPHNIGLGCTRNPALIQEISQITAKEVRATGIQWTFAPCVAVPRDIRWGRTYEGYSEDPALVASLGRAAVIGLQGKRLAGPNSVVGCAKHFVGDGGTTLGTSRDEGILDQGDTRIDEATLRAVHMAGYPPAIDAGVATIMPSYSSWNGVKCSGSRYLLTDVLKKELGFEGFLISDYNAIDQLVPPTQQQAADLSASAAGQVRTPDYKKCIEISINAGMDMVMVTERYREFITLLQELVHEKKVPVSRIDDAVTRILRVKFAHGMMGGDSKIMPDKAMQAEFGSPTHRSVARKAVSESVVLLKNEGAILPLKSTHRRIHLTGSGADNLGMQCGGWTIDWQGGLGEITEGGTTILAAVRNAVSEGTSVTCSSEGASEQGADLAIVVVGEEPYAEMKGDRTDLTLNSKDATTVSAMKAAGLPVVVVVLSGRPLVLGEVVEEADALVAAWLPGSEGDGIADVLFGKTPFTGKLSFSWPQSMAQVSASTTGGNPPLFPFGFGLTQ